MKQAACRWAIYIGERGPDGRKRFAWGGFQWKRHDGAVVDTGTDTLALFSSEQEAAEFIDQEALEEMFPGCEPCKVLVDVFDPEEEGVLTFDSDAHEAVN